MGRKRQDAPPLRPHASGQFYIQFGENKIYLGTDREQAEAERRRILAERLLRGPGGGSGGGGKPQRLTVNEVCAACCEYARSYYDESHLDRVYKAMDAVRHLYGTTPADEFDQVRLAAVRDYMLSRPNLKRPGEPLSRNYVNRMVGVIQTLWAWAATRGLVPGEQARNLTLVKAIRKGKGGRETPRVLSVPAEVVARTLPWLNHVVRAMVQLQQATGMRPGETTRITRGELSLTPDEVRLTTDSVPVHAIHASTGALIWLYVPAKHKTASKDHSRIVAIGLAGQTAIGPFLDRPQTAPLFSPREAQEARLAALRASRKTKVQPSQQNRRAKQRKRPWGDRYTTSSYGQAVRKAIMRANRHLAEKGEPPIPHWHPNQLRHAAGTEITSAFDQHHAQAALGHSTPDTTATYIDAQVRKAAEVAARLG